MGRTSLLSSDHHPYTNRVVALDLTTGAAGSGQSMLHWPWPEKGIPREHQRGPLLQGNTCRRRVVCWRTVRWSAARSPEGMVAREKWDCSSALTLVWGSVHLGESTASGACSSSFRTCSSSPASSRDSCWDARYQICACQMSEGTTMCSVSKCSPPAQSAYSRLLQATSCVLCVSGWISA